MVDEKTLSIYRKNHALKREIAIHQKTHERNSQIVQDLSVINSNLKSLAQATETLKKSKIICTPETEFTFSFQKTS